MRARFNDISNSSNHVCIHHNKKPSSIENGSMLNSRKDLVAYQGINAAENKFKAPNEAVLQRLKSMHNKAPQHGDCCASARAHNRLRQGVEAKIHSRPHHDGHNTYERQEQGMHKALGDTFLHADKEANGDIRGELGVGGRHAVI
jgi:hypothetical protein